MSQAEMIITIIAGIIAIFGTVFSVIKKIIDLIPLNHLENCIGIKYLKDDVKRNYIKNYIPPYFSREIPLVNTQINKKNKSLKYYKKVLKESQNTSQYNLILGTTGIGKTSFIFNLLSKYYRNIFPLIKKDMQIVDMRLLSPSNKFEDVLRSLIDNSKYKNTRKIILILEAFDEYYLARQNGSKILEEICEYLHGIFFYKVIITSRYEIFDIDNEYTKELYIFQSGLDNCNLKFNTIYLAFFNLQMIIKYLRKKYKLNFIIRKKAIKLIESTRSNIFYNPFLLGYLEDFVDQKDFNDYGNYYNVYSLIINSWILREYSIFRSMYSYQSKEIIKEEDFKTNTKSLLKKLANKFYNEGIKTITFENLKKEIGEYPILNNIIYKNEKIYRDIKTRQLLTRDSFNNISFAHASIYDYFCFENMSQSQEFENEGFSFENIPTAAIFYAQKFYNVLLKDFILKNTVKGYYYYSNKKFDINKLEPDDIARIERIDIEEISCSILRDILMGFKSLRKLKVKNIILDKVEINNYIFRNQINLINLKLVSLDGIQYFSNIKTLYVENTGISSIRLLENLINIERLSLSGNCIKDCFSLCKLSKLKDLDLSKNEIRDVSCLSGLMYLTELDISHNPIRDISVLSNSNLSILYVYGNSHIYHQNLSKLNLDELYLSAYGETNIGDILPVKSILANKNIKKLFTKYKNINIVIENSDYTRMFLSEINGDAIEFLLFNCGSIEFDVVFSNYKTSIINWPEVRELIFSGIIKSIQPKVVKSLSIESGRLKIGLDNMPTSGLGMEEISNWLKGVLEKSKMKSGIH